MENYDKTPFFFLLATKHEKLKKKKLTFHITFSSQIHVTECTPGETVLNYSFIYMENYPCFFTGRSLELALEAATYP